MGGLVCLGARLEPSSCASILRGSLGRRRSPLAILWVICGCCNFYDPSEPPESIHKALCRDPRETKPCAKACGVNEIDSKGNAEGREKGIVNLSLVSHFHFYMPIFPPLFVLKDVPRPEILRRIVLGK